jgi:signal transduction histidine kinase
MIQRQSPSLQTRLALRLAAVYIAATAIAVGALVYRAYDTAATLSERELSLRAADLAGYVSVDPSGVPRLDLPPKLQVEYAAAAGSDIFAIRGPGGRPIAAVPASFGEEVKRWPEAADEPSYFHLKNFGSESQDYYGLSISAESAAGPLSVSVARAADAGALAHSLVQEFVLDVAWIIPIFALITLGIGVLAIRGGLKPVRDVSEMATSIEPSAISVRLPSDHIPSEITPLVSAFNRALDRLEQGFAVQRQFTANAAHELRTPLAIITAALDAMDGNGELTKLKADVARMNRLIEQLLRVARLDAIALDVSQTVDLTEVARSTVEMFAPWVVAHQRTIAFADRGAPVRVRGNRHAIADALQNLIENALAYAPSGTEVTVYTQPNGAVTVTDQGPGIPAADRERIFDRFWRGKGSPSLGAGLGLAIVMETMKAHGGSVVVDDAPGGGARFTLSFPTQPTGVFKEEKRHVAEARQIDRDP